MILLGLTGSIGMGKSATARLFAQRGIPVWDADATVHDLYGQGGAAVAPLDAAFKGVVQNGAVDREALRKIVTTNAEALGLLNSIVHPLVAEARAQFLSDQTGALVVLDIPLLFETGSADQFDKIAVVSVDADTQRKRVLARKTMTPDQFEAILAQQVPDAKKRARADYVIDTSTPETAKRAVERILAELT